MITAIAAEIDSFLSISGYYYYYYYYHHHHHHHHHHYHHHHHHHHQHYYYYCYYYFNCLVCQTSSSIAEKKQRKLMAHVINSRAERLDSYLLEIHLSGRPLTRLGYLRATI